MEESIKLVKQTRTLNIICLVLNATVVSMIVLTFYFVIKSNNFTVQSLADYTILTSLVTALGAFLMVWSNIVSIIQGYDCTPRLFFSVRFLSAVMSVITLVTVMLVLRPQDTSGVDPLLDYASGALFLHFLGPVFSIIQFLFIEIQPKAIFKKTIEPFIATLIYCLAILITTLVINAVSGPEAAVQFSPYFFFCVTPNMVDELIKIGVKVTVWQNVMYLVGVVLCSYALSIFLWAINRTVSTIFLGVEIEIPKQEKEEEEEEVKGVKAYLAHKFSFHENRPSYLGHIYHVSHHNRKLQTWKVKSEKAGRALKVFKTQKEAIDYANQQVKLHGGRVRVHSNVGKFVKDKRVTK